jgi:integrase
VVVETLHTREHAEARIRALELHAQYEAAFKHIRKGGEWNGEHPSGVDGRGINPFTQRPLPAKETGTIFFSEACEQYLAELERDPDARPTALTIAAHRSVFATFKTISRDLPLGTITRTVARDFLDTLGQRRGLSNTTLNKYISSLSQVWKHFRRAGSFAGDNVWTDQWRRKPRNTGWKAYTLEELKILFAAEPARSPSLPWLMRLALFTGCRLNELAQLTRENVRQEHGIWFLEITDKGADQSLKTKASKRMVPLHSAIRDSFLAYVKTIPSDTLWPELRAAGPDRRLSWRVSDQFTGFRRKAGIDRPGLTFHSLRKNFVAALDNADIPLTDIQMLVGHARPFTLAVYGGPKILKSLQAAVEAVEFPGLKI